MKTYQIIIRKQGEFFKELTITALNSLSGIDLIAKNLKLPTFEMYGPDGEVHEYVSPIYEFEAREMGMVLS